VKSKQLIKHLFLMLISALTLTSCNYFIPKQSPQNVKNIDTLIDFTKVDAFPLFAECKDIPSLDKQKICFQIKMAEHIQALIKSGVFKTPTQSSDTLLVFLKVLQSGKTQIVSVKSSSKNVVYERLLFNILQLKVDSIPTLLPALKRGMPVTTQFELPIIIQN